MPVLVVQEQSSEARFVVPDGGPLIEICEREFAPIVFSCRSASCGTCRVDVLEGAALLELPNDDEVEVLQSFGDTPGQRRLACQARLLPLEGVLRIRQIEG